MTRLPSNVRISVSRRLMRTTVPRTSPMATWSPPRNGSRVSRITPANRLPSTCWNAMPAAMETIPSPPSTLTGRTLGKATVRAAPAAMVTSVHFPSEANTEAKLGLRPRQFQYRCKANCASRPSTKPPSSTSTPTPTWAGSISGSPQSVGSIAAPFR